MPIRLDSAEQQLTGGALDREGGRDAAVDDALADIEALDDLHATAAYRRRVAAVLARARRRRRAWPMRKGAKPHAH